MRSRLSLIVTLGLFTIPTITLADSLSLGLIAQELKQDAVIPLAKNLLAAQAAAPYTQFESDSLQVSIDAVRRCD